MKKIIIGSVELRKALDKCFSCINSSSFFPICENVMFVANEEDSYLHLTDMRNHIRYPLEFERDAPGQFLVSHIELRKYLKILPECPVTIMHNPDTYQLEIVAANDRVEIGGENHEDFPKWPEGEVKGTISFKKSLMEDCFKTASHFTGEYEWQECILMSDMHDEVAVYGTNGHIAFKQVLSGLTPGFGRKVLNVEIAKMMSVFNGEEIEMNLLESKYYLTDGNIQITGALHEQYGGIENLFPAHFKEGEYRRIRIQRGDLLNTLKKAEIFSNQVSKELMIAFKASGEMEISCNNIDHNHSYQTAMKYDGDDPLEMNIGFSAGLLTTALSSFTEDEITFFLKAIHAPVFLQGKSDTSMALVMPYNLNKKKENGSNANN